MLKSLLFTALSLIAIFQIKVKLTATATTITASLIEETPVRRPFNFIVARQGDNPLTAARQIDNSEAWFVQRRKRLLAIQRKLFSARRNINSGSRSFGNSSSVPKYKSKRLDYFRKSSSAFAFASKGDEKPIKYKVSSDYRVYFVSLPVVVPPLVSDPFEFHGPSQTCVKGNSGFLCCNRTLEEVIIKAYEEMRNLPSFSHYNMHRITREVQRASEKRFGCNFEVIATGSDFVSKTNFNGDLNCKVRVDGKVILAYATPTWRPTDDIELIDASSLLSADGPISVERTTIAANKLTQIRQRLVESNLVSSVKGENLLVGEEQKPIFLVYGPIH